MDNIRHHHANASLYIHILIFTKLGIIIIVSLYINSKTANCTVLTIMIHYYNFLPVEFVPIHVGIITDTKEDLSLLL